MTAYWYKPPTMTNSEFYARMGTQDAECGRYPHAFGGNPYHEAYGAVIESGRFGWRQLRSDDDDA